MNLLPLGLLFAVETILEWGAMRLSVILSFTSIWQWSMMMEFYK